MSEEVVICRYCGSYPCRDDCGKVPWEKVTSADEAAEKAIKTYKKAPPIVDPICIVHGKKMSEHDCLYCCLCFKSLTPEECSTDENGQKQNVCEKCASDEEAYGEWKKKHGK